MSRSYRWIVCLLYVLAISIWIETSPNSSSKTLWVVVMHDLQEAGFNGAIRLSIEQRNLNKGIGTPYLALAPETTASSVPVYID